MRLGKPQGHREPGTERTTAGTQPVCPKSQEQHLIKLKPFGSLNRNRKGGRGGEMSRQHRALIGSAGLKQSKGSFTLTTNQLAANLIFRFL